MPTPTTPLDAPARPLSAVDAAALERIAALNPKADPRRVLPDVPPSRLPRHIAIIMDGNGRWARAQGLPRSAGHRAGAEAVRRTIEASGELGVEVLTLYSFSIENWRRPRDEIDALMGLYIEYTAKERDRLVEHNIRFRQIGRREGLPPSVLESLDKTLDATRHCTGPILNLAVNYGGRAEIVDAARALAEKAQRGEVDPASIDEAAFENELTTAGLPDPDLLVRTAGEMRVSNYLLWQISYAELHVTDTLWPEFRRETLHAAIRDYASRDRRFGGLASDTPSA